MGGGCRQIILKSELQWPCPPPNTNMLALLGEGPWYCAGSSQLPICPHPWGQMMASPMGSVLELPGQGSASIMVVESAQPVQGAAEAQSPPVPYPVMGAHGLPMARQGGGSCVGAGLGAPGGPSWVGAPPVGSASPCTQSVPHWPLPGCSLCSEPQLPLSRHSGQTPAAGSPSTLHPASPPQGPGPACESLCSAGVGSEESRPNMELFVLGRQLGVTRGEFRGAGLSLGEPSPGKPRGCEPTPHWSLPPTPGMAAHHHMSGWLQLREHSFSSWTQMSVLGAPPCASGPGKLPELCPEAPWEASSDCGLH